MGGPRCGAPPLALQRAVAGDLLRPRLAARLGLALPVALWLCATDRRALARARALLPRRLRPAAVGSLHGRPGADR